MIDFSYTCIYIFLFIYVTAYERSNQDIVLQVLSRSPSEGKQAKLYKVCKSQIESSPKV